MLKEVSGLCMTLFIIYLALFDESLLVLTMPNETKRQSEQMSRVLRKLAIMHVRKVSSTISLCSPHRLIRDEIFRCNEVSS